MTEYISADQAGTANVAAPIEIKGGVEVVRLKSAPDPEKTKTTSSQAPESPKA
jgi:hypothetical protein